MLYVNVFYFVALLNHLECTTYALQMIGISPVGYWDPSVGPSFVGPSYTFKGFLIYNQLSIA